MEKESDDTFYLERQRKGEHASRKGSKVYRSESFTDERRNTKMHDEDVSGLCEQSKVYLMRRDGLVSMVFEI